MNHFVVLAVAVAFIAANAFFVAMEFALLTARRAGTSDSRAGATSGLGGPRSVNVQLAACQLGITVMSLMLGWIAGPAISGAADSVLGRSALPDGAAVVLGMAVTLMILSFVHMVAAEVVPRSMALARPDDTLRLLAPVHRAVTTALLPVLWVLNGLGSLGARLLRVDTGFGPAQAHTPEELRVMLDEAAAKGQLAAGEAELLSGALGFLRVKVREVMAPARDLVTVPAAASVAEAEALLVRSGHSRVLVTDGDVVIGFLHVKDLLAYEEMAPTDLLPPGLVRVALRVGPEEALPDVLLKMRRARRHVAVVTGDANAPIGGLVTMEDILEAIVGDITDESDRPSGAHDPGGSEDG